jgi:hypothetical protein
VTCRDPATPHVLKTRAQAFRLKAGACVLMHTITLCYSLHPSVAPVIKSESTLGLSEVVVYGLPVSNGFMLPVRITRGYLYWAPCVSAPRLSIAWFRTRGRQRRVCACRGCSASTPLSVHQWHEMCEGWAAACARMCGPGACRGTLAALESDVSRSRRCRRSRWLCNVRYISFI